MFSNLPFLAVPEISRYVYFVRSHLQCETVDVVQAALQATNKREREASPAASGHEKKKAASSKLPALMAQFEELSSQFMSFLSNDQAEGEYTSPKYTLLANQ